MNVSGKYSFSQSGFANNKAIGVVQTPEGNIQLLAKVQKNSNKPNKAVAITTFKPYKSQRKVALAVAKATRGYRNDLVKDAVVKASALTRVRKQKKTYATKSRR